MLCCCFTTTSDRRSIGNGREEFERNPDIRLLRNLRTAPPLAASMCAMVVGAPPVALTLKLLNNAGA